MSTSKATTRRATIGADRAHVVFFGGKGGVGKTTCAAALAVAAARSGRRVLVVSTDPAHSLADALDVRLSSTVRKVPVGSGRSLEAVELDAARAFARWLGANRRVVGDVLEHGTWLDRADVEELLDLSVPGVDELVALIEIDRLIAAPRARRYDLVVVDTAPTGHTLRLVAAPDAVAAIAETLDTLQRRHRIVRERFAGVSRQDAADELIASIAADARRVGERLRDPRQSSFRLVLLPEPMAIAETDDALTALGQARIRVTDLVVNRLTPAGPGCPVCDGRRREERRALLRIRRVARQRPVRLIPAAASEPRGVAALMAIGRLLIAPRQSPLRLQPLRSRVRRTPAPVTIDVHTPPERIGAIAGARLLFFGGKGGVGKTTCAAAAALRIAAADRNRRVLLLSADPAHSLGDVLGIVVGDGVRGVPGAPPNLRVRELDARAALVVHRRRLEAALTEIASTVGSASVTGGQSAGELIELAPPGIDELVGIVEVADELKASGDEATARDAAYDLVIVDTAPTGHALRLLETPAAAQQWLRVLMRVLLKYRALVRPGPLGAELLQLSKSIRRLQERLQNAAETRFVVVTRAAEVPRLETDRLLRRLLQLHISAPIVIVNAATLGPRLCEHCREAAAAERRVRARLARSCRRGACDIIMSPLVAPPPRGAAALFRWAARWSPMSVEH